MMIRLYEPECKDEILKIIKDNNLPLEWEDHIDGAGVVTSTEESFDFTKLDELVSTLDPVFEETELVSMRVSVRSKTTYLGNN